MSALPTEIIAEILSKLPVKSLLRFLCVCKSWKSLIKSPTFVKIHLNQTLICNSDRHLLLSYYSLHSAELDLHHNRLSFSELNHPLNPLKGVRLVGSCNGVLCISDNSFNDIILYNPLTKSHRKLPSNQFPSPKLHMNVFGFGYDGKTDDYKVLKMVQGFEENFNSEAQVYSLNNNSWKSVQCIKEIFERADLWVMKEYGDEESWMKLCSIRQLESISGCIQLRPVVYSKDGRRILLEINNCKFGWYDLESETVEIFAAHGLPNRPFETSFFMGSLISFEE
ncbi:F-box protein CPR1-like isoform X2 [Spinacia oleracea]|uniref:F-box protein CPR1-like isoform X2 n=1 Tax=Spinacia oleracea TaxID=3562 RepID=A0A9R0KDA5_SPIOL|nr:F-box protein CPR1-like isoform X2 [Spinacia oleracea]